MGRKARYYVVVEWVDIFGEKYSFEQWCINEKDVERKIQYYKWTYKHDPLVAEFKVYNIVR